MDGPCEEATRENLSFVAEQVSHHPPSKSTCGKLLLVQVYWLQTIFFKVALPFGNILKNTYSYNSFNVRS